MPDLPAHASPALCPTPSPRPSLTSYDIQLSNTVAPPSSLISPAFTPPFTPGLDDDEQSCTRRLSSNRAASSVPVDTSARTGSPRPELVEILPEVQCIVRARIPTTTGTEMYLHLYENNVDRKEHLAIVFGSNIRSRSLDAERLGETEQDRMIRGAYVGRLYPGRTSSRVSQLASSSTGKASPLLQGIQKRVLHKDIPQDPLPAPAHASPIRKGPDSPSQSESVQSTPISVVTDDSTSTTDMPSPETQGKPEPPLVRIHSECYTGETVWSARCDCGEQLDEAARLMSESSTDDPSQDPGSVIIYLRQEGRGIGLSEKLKAYNLQDLGSDTYEANLLLRHPADARSYGLATAMLVDLGLGGDRGIKLLTNNPDKIRAVEGPGREVIVRERVAMIPLAWKTGGKQGVKGKEVEGYLRAKIEQFGHMLSEPR